MTVIKQTLLYGLSMVFMRGISLLMLPFITVHLAQTEFGKLEILSTIAAFGSIFAGLGLESALYRFVGERKSQPERQRVAAEIFSLTLLIGALFLPIISLTLLYWPTTFIYNISAYQLSLVLCLLALEGVIAVPLGWLRMENQAGKFFIAATTRALAQAGLTVSFLLLNKGLTGVLEAGLLAGLLQALGLSLWQLRHTGLCYPFANLRIILRYSAPIMLSGLFAFSFNGLDRWTLASVSNLETIAQFAIAAKFGLALVLALQPFGMWWMPKRFDVLYADNGKLNAARIAGYGIQLALLLAMLTAFITPWAIDMLFPSNYSDAKTFAFWLIIAALSKELTELINLGSFTGKNTYNQMYINGLCALIAVALLWGLGYQFNVYGVLAALVITQTLRLLLFFWLSQKMYWLPFSPMLLFSILLTMLWLLLYFITAHGGMKIIIMLTAPIATILFNYKVNLLPSYARLFKKTNSLN